MAEHDRGAIEKLKAEYRLALARTGHRGSRGWAGEVAAPTESYCSYLAQRWD